MTRTGTPDGSAGGPKVKPKNMDRYALRQLRKLLKSGNAIDGGEFSKAAHRAINRVVESRSAGTYNKQDKKITRRVASLVDNLDSTRKEDRKTQHISKRLNRLGGNAPGITGGRPGGNVGLDLGSGSGPRHPGGSSDNPASLDKPHRRHGGRGNGGRGSGGKPPAGVKFTEQQYRDNPGLRALARKLVNSDANSQLRDIKRLVTQLNRQGGQQARDIRTTGRRTRGDLNTIFGEVADYNRAQNEGIDKNYQALMQQVTQGNAATNAQTAQTTQGNLGALTGELGRLGISEAGTGYFNSEAAFGAQQAQQAQGNLGTNIGMQQAGADAVGALLGSTIQGERASSVGQAWNAQNDALTNNRDTVNNAMTDLRQQALDVRKGRGGQIEQLLMQLQDRDYNRWAEQSQNNFLNQMQANAFNLNVDQFNASNQWNRMQLLQQQAAARTMRGAQQTAAAGKSIMNQINGIFFG